MRFPHPGVKRIFLPTLLLLATAITANAAAKILPRDTHIASRDEFSAPPLADSQKNGGEWTIKATFRDRAGQLFKDGDLFVQCFLIGPRNEWRKLVLHDDGRGADEQANDGIYTGRYYFSPDERGFWQYYLLAKIIDHPAPEGKTEEAMKNRPGQGAPSS